MIYILTGIAKAGKSYLTTRIIKEYAIGSFSSDYLMISLALGNPELHLNPDASDSTVSLQLRPYLMAMIQTMVENNIDYLIEGVHFQPEFSRELMEKFPNKVKILYLGYRLIDSRAKKEELKLYGPASKNHWYKAMNDKELTHLVEYLKKESERLYLDCQKYGLNYVEITNIAQQSDEIIHNLMGSK